MCFVQSLHGCFTVILLLFPLSQRSMQNVGLGIPALAHGRKPKSASCNSLGLKLPDIVRDFQHTLNRALLIQATELVLAEVNDHNKHRIETPDAGSLQGRRPKNRARLETRLKPDDSGCTRFVH